MKISIRLPLAVIVSIITPVVLVYYFTYNYVHEELHKSNESKLVAIAKIRTQQVSDYLFVYESKLRTISKESIVKKMLIRKKNIDSAELRSSLKTILSAANVKRVVIFDANGKYVESTDGIEHKSNSSAFLNLSKDNPSQVYTYIFKDELPQVGMITAVTENGVLLGYIAYSFGYEWFDNIGKDYTGLGRTGETIIAGWAADKQAYFFTHRRFNDVELGSVDFGVQKPAIAYALKGIDGFSHDYVDYRGVPVVASTNYIPRYGIGVVVKMDIAEVHESLRYMFTLGIAAFIVCLIIVIAVVWFVLYGVGKRIESYAEVAMKITDGNLDMRIKDDVKDEISQLGDALNSMTSRLVVANSELQKLLNEKTKKLEITEELFQTTFEMASVGLAHASVEGRFLKVNKAYSDMVGYTQEELLSMGFRDITYPEDLASDIEHSKNMLSGEVSIYKTQKRYIHKDSHIVWVLISVVIVRDTHGKPLYFIAAAQDITSIKELEATNAELLAHLKASNIDLQQFAYVASHDLQEPLRMVSSYVQLIEKRYKDILDSDGKEFMEYAVDGAKRMQSLINGLLEFSRINTRGGDFVLLDMNGIVEVVKRDLVFQLEEADVTVTYDTLPKIIADVSQMEQLLLNLLSNAIKYRSGQKAQVHIGFVNEDSYWHFFVKDNGIGIKKEYFEKIFLIFQRLHKRESYPGTGIGLAICKRIVDRHGGEIWVESEIGKGSIFHFTISKKLQEGG